MGIVKCLEGRLVAMEYYDTINYRGWVKSFNMKQLERAAENKLHNYLKHLKGFLEHEKERFEVIRYEDIKKAHLGLFTTKAPYYFVVYITDLEVQLLNAGYLMGQFSLYLMTKEIGSCLVGLEEVKKYVSSNVMVRSDTIDESKPLEQRTWVAIMAFGNPEHKFRQKRKKLGEIISDKKCIYKSEMDPRVQAIISAGVHAPSKMMIRPYRFVVKGLRAHLLVKVESMMTASQRMCVYLDCGIMLASLSLKAEEQWMTMEIRRNEKHVETQQKKYKYIVSLSFEDQ